LCVFRLQQTVRESGASVTHAYLPTLPADETQMIQLFQNLIANAIKFHKAEEVPQIHIQAQKQERHWLFSVQDNGFGIDPRFHDRIFVIFQRLHNRESYQGTGIGLAVRKRIVERHGGTIWVESMKGQGATFYFTLPIQQDP